MSKHKWINERILHNSSHSVAMLNQPQLFPAVGPVDQCLTQEAISYNHLKSRRHLNNLNKLIQVNFCLNIKSIPFMPSSTHFFNKYLLSLPTMHHTQYLMLGTQSWQRPGPCTQFTIKCGDQHRSNYNAGRQIF